MVITPEVIATIKFFGWIISLLLSAIAVLGAIVWRGLNRQINKIEDMILRIEEKTESSLREYKEDEKNRCALCAAHNKYEHEALRQEHDDLWAAIDECCPRGK